MKLTTLFSACQFNPHMFFPSPAFSASSTPNMSQLLRAASDLVDPKPISIDF